MNQTPTPGTKPLRGTHDLGEIVGYAYRVYFANFAVLLGLALLNAPLQLLSGVITQSSDSDAALTIANLLVVPQVAVALITVAALICAVHTITGGGRASFNDSLDAGFERFGAVARTFLLFIGLVIASVFAPPFLAVYWLFNRRATIDGTRNWWLAIVPFLLLMYLAVRWGFALPAAVIDRKENWPALDESARLVRGSWWRVFGILLIVGLIVVGPSLLTSFGSVLPPLAAAGIAAAVSCLLQPFATIAQLLLFYDLNTRNQVPSAIPQSGEPEEIRDDERTT